MYKFIISYIKINKKILLIFLKCRPKSFGILRTCCKVYAIFKKKTYKKIQIFFEKDAEIILELLAICKKNNIFYYFFNCIIF